MMETGPGNDVLSSAVGYLDLTSTIPDLEWRHGSLCRRSGLNLDVFPAPATDDLLATVRASLPVAAGMMQAPKWCSAIMTGVLDPPIQRIVAEPNPFE